MQKQTQLVSVGHEQTNEIDHKEKPILEQQT